MIYEMNPAWQVYYMETEPLRRAELLQRLLKEEPDDGGNIRRWRLFSLRHFENGSHLPDINELPEKGVPEPSVDRYLWQFVNLTQVYHTSRFFKKGGEQEIRQFFRDCGFDEAVSSGPVGEEVLYREIRNAAKRYFKTCQGSEYRRTLFGLLSPSSADQQNQTCKDVWKMTFGIEKRFGLSGTIRVWIKAVQDEYERENPAAAEQMEKLSRSMSK